MNTLLKVKLGPCSWEYYFPGLYEDRITITGRIGFWYIGGKEFLTLKAAETYAKIAAEQGNRGVMFSE